MSKIVNAQTSRFLGSKFNLHNSSEVKNASRRTGSQLNGNTQLAIGLFLSRFQSIIDLRDEDKNERLKKEKSMQAFKRKIHMDSIIRPIEIPESYWGLQKRIIEERGELGDLHNGEFSDDHKKQDANRIILEQKASLDKWIDYLSSPDSNYFSEENQEYLMGIKYFVFRSVLGLQSFNKEKRRFEKRSKGTTSTFPELNREALAYTFNFFLAKLKGEAIKKPHSGVSDEAFSKIITKENFSEVYGFALLENSRNYGELLQNTNGEWIKFPKGSDHKPLVNSLEGKATGWCTATDETAKKQLHDGDFYVYYSEDEDGKFTIPRVAIRMEGNSISEVRGIEKDQNLDQYIGDIAEEKLKDFGEEGEKYKKRVEDMKKFNYFYKMLKINPESELNKEDLKFLYEIDNNIEGFGYNKDPRIKELKKSRNNKKDLTIIFDCNEDQVSLNSMDCIIGKKIVCHYGNFSLGKLDNIPDGTVFPEIIYGDFSLENIKKIGNNVILPKKIYGEDVKGTTNLNSLQYIGNNVTFPRSIHGTSFSNLKFVGDNVVFPEDIISIVNFLKLKKIGNGVIWPIRIMYSFKIPLSFILSGKFKLPNYIGDGLTIEDDLTNTQKFFLRFKKIDFKHQIHIGWSIKASNYVKDLLSIS